MKIDNYTVVVEKQLVESVGGLTVDWVKNGWSEGFSVRPTNQEPNACGSCSC